MPLGRRFYGRIYPYSALSHAVRRSVFPVALAMLLAFALAGVSGVSAQTSPAPPAATAPPATASDQKHTDAPPAIPPASADDSEVKLGRENAAENDKQVKLVTDPAIVERVNRIGQDIAAIANKYPFPAIWGSTQLKQFQYSFKVVDDKDVNAYSLPGGFIYVNKGLLDFVRSDDELAGVLAHEVAHAAHHHMMKLMREQKKINAALLPLQLLALGLFISKPGVNAGDAQNLLLATQLYTIAKVNTYGVEAEKDADHMAVDLLQKTKYSPVGLYSFMLRLAALEKSKILVDLGIFRTHPPGEERVAAAMSLLKERDIPITLSQVDPTLRATSTLVKGQGEGAELAEIKFRDTVLCRVTADMGMTTEERGLSIAKRLTTLIDAKLMPFEVRVSPDQSRVLVRGQMLLTLADAAAQGKTTAQLARELGDAILQVNQRRQLSTGL